MDATSPATIVTAASTALVGLISLHQSRVGKRLEREAQIAANELQRKAQDHDVYKDMVADLERQVDRCEERAEKQARSAERLIAARDAEIVQLRDDRHRERGEHQIVVAHLRDIIATLRDVVRSEVARTLAEDGLDVADAIAKDEGDK